MILCTCIENIFICINFSSNKKAVKKYTNIKLSEEQCIRIAAANNSGFNFHLIASHTKLIHSNKHFRLQNELYRSLDRTVSFENNSIESSSKLDGKWKVFAHCRNKLPSINFATKLFNENLNACTKTRRLNCQLTKINFYTIHWSFSASFSWIPLEAKWQNFCN